MRTIKLQKVLFHSDEILNPIADLERKLDCKKEYATKYLFQLNCLLNTYEALIRDNHKGPKLYLTMF
jgi:hypothetical protein